MSVPVKEAFPIQDIVERAQSYGMPGVIVDGMDVLAVKEAVEEAAKRARRGDGPTLIECKTYRYLGHSKSDPRAYRTKEEENQWKERDAIKRYKKWLLDNGVATKEEIEKIDEEIEKEVEEAVDFAEKSPYPPLEEITKDVYVEEDFAESERKKGTKVVKGITEWNGEVRTITYREALNEALREELKRDENVSIAGEDLPSMEELKWSKLEAYGRSLEERESAILHIRSGHCGLLCGFFHHWFKPEGKLCMLILLVCVWTNW